MMHKRVEDSLTEQTYLVMHKHINGYGRLFGGQLLAWIDELAGIVARRHAGSEVTTACIDQLHFKHPVHLNETLVMVGRITYVGKTSMEIRIDSYVEDLDGMRRLINRAYLVMVAVDLQSGKAKPVPGLILETEVQRAEWDCGERRTELRKQRKKEGY
jgi:acyl-CoA hydrolase